MELFKIFGTLALSGQDDFDRDVDRATGKGKQLASTIGNGLKNAAKVGAVAVGAAATAVATLTKKSIDGFAEYEQLAGGMEKIFSGMDTSRIATDAANAYKNLGMSANEYLATINDVGAGFAATMGAEAGYNAAQKGLAAISDYASGTGKNLNDLSQKFTMITRSTSSYQSIADQFSGILPATSAGFLEQAQAAGFLSSEYENLTEVPINEYQQAVTEMLALGVEGLNLTGNTAAEATETISGSLAMTKAAFSNWLVSLADSNANIQETTQQLFDSVLTTAENLLPVIQTVLTTLITTIQTQAPEIINTLLSYITSNLPQVVTAGVELLAALVTGIINAIPDLIAAVPELISALVETLSAAWPQIEQAGRDALNALWNGIRGVWDSICSWFDGVWNSLFGGRSVTVTGGVSGGGVNGSHASGLNYVPFDNYVAQLHKGEAVLTAEEAATWRAGKTAGGMSTNASAPVTPQEIITNITLELDGAVLARKMYRHNQTVTNDRGLSFVRG